MEILGREFAWGVQYSERDLLHPPGVLVSDCFRAYDHRALADWLKQKCFAHFTHALGKLSEEKKRGAVRFPRALLAVLREALELGKQQATLDRESFATLHRELEEKLDVLIAEKRQFSDPDNARLANRLTFA